MNQALRDCYDAGDARGIVATQVDDGPLTVMCSSAYESAQFALMLIHEAEFAGHRPGATTLRVREVDEASGTVLVDSPLGGTAAGLPSSHFVPQPDESLVPFLVRAVQALLDVSESLGLSAAA